MINYPYKEFLTYARQSMNICLQEAKDVTDSLGLTFSLDEGFPWKGDFRTAVGRCGYWDEDVNFNISIHLKTIYEVLRELEEDDLLFGLFDIDNRETDAEDNIRTTIFHEIGHGILHYFWELFEEDTDFSQWCIENGFDKTLFSDNDDYDEEFLCEEYANHSDSEIEKFVSLFQEYK